MQINLSLLFLLVCLFTAHSQNLESVSDDDLLQLIKQKEKLIVFFTKPSCETCLKFEQQLNGIHEELTQQVGAETVRTENSHLARLYNPTKEPAIVFFRHGIPLLYSGEPDANEIYEYFEKNKTPAVKELTDKIFEHMTQAATGATTGDWFVMFYGASCVECQRLHAVWEGVGATLRGRVNVARVDAALAGALTAKRFHVTKLPTFLFFRLGKVYKYDLPKHDVKSFVSFAQDWYKNAKSDPVPLLASPFDEIVDWCVQMIKFAVELGLKILNEHPWIWQIGVGGFGMVVITGVIALLKAQASRPRPADTKKDKKSK
ncbi:protein disulfide-isomerase A4 [Plutella xylostella]|uniref:protein disulfide-isomerase A4 n=1 Tax=Plutella xylostella TaxID=51655 RepID=UPI0020327914|nr:protein disulfide-isomerase A4 [Plutella xylostella]